ncbi:hypothetical protein OOJ91_34275 [Micromonospora lupini]|uniref:hypothetical protein n=1 Tax=Micromonospora lupini TaxID=285679 RepID=UPI00224E11ED|nr:hypothetical protein [Micromonospora lupini]MCX5070917.1 hypothetical protein [Micromonospora lupini]
MRRSGRKTTKGRGVRVLTRAQRTTVLHRAAWMVAEINDAQPKCVEGVALLDRVADLVHIKAEPVPVAVAVQGPAGSCLLGEAVDGVIPVSAGGRVIRSPTTALWSGAGHLVLFSSEEKTLFDPTLDQVNPATGFARGALIMPVTADELFTEDLTLTVDEGVKVLYRAVRGDTSWRTAYNTTYARSGLSARTVARRALELEGFDEDLVPA